jgi:hypothetical protein
VIAAEDGCKVSGGAFRVFQCGPLKLKAGETKTFRIDGSPKDAGNFGYGIGLGDARPGGLRQWPYQETFSEAVRA